MASVCVPSVFKLPQELPLDSGQSLSNAEIAYETYGELNEAKSNAILICHALTGDQHVAGPHPATGKPGWWAAVVGPGKPIDTDRFFVICANVLGGCMGSTGPKEIDPTTDAPWGVRFPVITIGDMVRAQVALIDKALTELNEGRPARRAEVDEEERKAWNMLQLLTAKPVLYVANVDEDSAAEGNDYSKRVLDYAAEEGAQAVVISAQIEAEISQLEDEEQTEFLETLGLEEPGLNRLIHAGYALLGLQTYFTAGPKESRAWTVRQGATAPQAAGVIHGDFEKGFIRAETIAYDDYVANNGETGAKDAGKMRAEGKDYVVQDGDVMLFRFNV